MNTNVHRFITTNRNLLIGLMIVGVAAPGSASLADRAGIWATQPVESVMVRPDGAKASADLGPARTAALGHLDSDGVIDLVVAYGSEGTGFAVLTLGDPRFRLGAHHDRELELQGLPPEKPFVSEATVYELPLIPDWAAVGDFDSDGDFDVVFAAYGLAGLFWMAGDGEGHLDAGHLIDLEGGVTAFACDDVNRRDGLDDVVVAVNGEAGPALLVFEDPLGALSDAPDRLMMPATVSSLAIDWIDGDVWKDIAAGAGNQVLLISGHDRRSEYGQEDRDEALPKSVIPIDFTERVLDLDTGDFVGSDREAQVAVRLAGGEVYLIRNADGDFEVSALGRLPAEGRMISARSSGLPGHDLLLHRSSTGRVEMFHANQLKVVGRSLEGVPAPETLVSGIITGRLNVDTREDLVFLRQDGGVEIAASKNRIAIVVDTTDDIDNGGCHFQGCSLREAIISANIQPSGSTITFDLPLGSTIEPDSELPTLTQPVATIIDGTVSAGVVTGLMTLQGASAGSATGLRVTGGNATISSLHIRGFEGAGMSLDTGGNNLILGCRLGIDGVGSGSDPNSYGLQILVSDDNTIGGTASREGNVISGNLLNGVHVSSSDVDDSADNTLLGNFIGTNSVGSSSISNEFHGVFTDKSFRSQIGSAVAGGGNVVSGNGDNGIYINSEGENGFSLVIGNTIGLNAQETAEISNSGFGLLVEDEGYTSIGGSNAVTRNVISGNEGNGIEITGACPNTVISGNYIGTDGDGLAAFPNYVGIRLTGCQAAIIGGPAMGEGNLISGNLSSAIVVKGSSDQVDIEGNTIGVAVDGSPLGNGWHGLYLDNLTDGEVTGNTIAHNGLDGVAVNLTSSVFVGINSIFENDGLGIDLENDGVTLNDPLDADDGPNHLQNFPEIESVDADSGTVGFSISSSADRTFDIRFFESPGRDPSGHGEGKTYLGTKNDVTTDGSGVATGQVVFADLTPGSVITATATDSGWNTSEFSPCFTVPYGADHIFSDGFDLGNTSAWTSVTP